MSTDAYKNWTPATQEKALALLQEHVESDWRPFYCSKRACDGQPHGTSDGWDFPHARGAQRPPRGDDWLTWAFLGGRGCVAPWTRIYLPETGEHVRVDQIDTQVTVDTPTGPHPTDGAPFIKGIADMWTVTFDDGNQITVTDQHRLLAPTGWLRLADVHVGQPLVAAPHAPLEEGSSFLSSSPAGAPRSTGTGEGYLGHCSTCHRPDGQRLHPQPEDDQASAPSRAGASARSLDGSRQGAPASSRGCSRACRPASPLARSSCAPGGASLPDGGCLDEPSPDELPLGVSRSRDQSPRTSSLDSTSREGALGRTLLCSGEARACRCTDEASLLLPAVAAQWSDRSHLLAGRDHREWPLPRSGPVAALSSSPDLLLDVAGTPGESASGSQSSLSTRRSGLQVLEPSSPVRTATPSAVPVRLVTSIEYSHCGPFYDLTVPGPSGYYAEGTVNHNSGKTRGGSEWTHRLVKKYPGCRIALVSPTGPEVRDTIVEGESGLLNTAEPGNLPDWEPSKKKLTWPNGSTAWGYSGEEPDRLRGKQHHFGWLDEPAHMPLIDDVWSNFLFGLRLGQNPHALLTTSPLPIKWLKDILADEYTQVTRSTTYDNLANLPPHFQKIILNRYEGTRLGRQEIMGELLDEIEGALWSTDMIDDHRIIETPDLVRVVVGVDPAGTAGKRSDETGIVVAGVDEHDEYHVIADYSGRYSPEGWARKAIDVSSLHKADAIVVEITYGRDMVTSVINNAIKPADLMPKIIPVDSRRGKQLRAEPIVALYERGKVHHGDPTELETLEDQQVTWVPGVGNSPDRIDAIVHALTHLAVKVEPSAISSPFRLLRRGPRGLNPFMGG